MLGMGTTRHQRNLHIGDLGACQHARMASLGQVCQNQSLPVPIQHIFTAPALKHQAASPLARLQKQMYLRIMTQGLKMSHALHHIFNGLFVYDTACAKFHRNAKALLHQALQNLNLYLAHHPHVNLREFFLPDHMELREFFLQPAKLL